MSSTLWGPRRIIRQTPSGEMADLMSICRELSAHLLILFPGMLAPADCESPFTRNKEKKIVAETLSVRLFLAIQQALGSQELGNVYSLQDWEIQRLAWRKLKATWRLFCVF